MPGPANRLNELDALRIGALALLIAYHVGMFYVPWDWHVKSAHPVPELEPWMLLLAPWRMSLLFLVSGAATALLLQRGGATASLRSRSARLLWPLAFGMAVIVPPQPYLEVVQKLGYAGSYLEFLGRYFQADHSFCRGRDCLELPTWNHLWFLPYLWVYTALVMAALRLRRGAWAASGAWQTLTRGSRLIWVPGLAFALVRLGLQLPFPSTHNLRWDWFNHGLYGLMFLLGFVLFGAGDDRHGAWAAALRWRWLALAGSALSLVGMPWLLEQAGGWNALPGWAQQAWLVVGAWRHWLPVLAALGFARRHRQRLAFLQGARWRWLNEAVFPVYIVHQTFTVVLAVQLARLGLPQGLEALVLVALTVLGSLGCYGLVKRWRLLRPFFGLATRPSPAAPGP